MVPGTSTEGRGKALIGALAHRAGGAKILADADIIRPVRPDKLARMAATLLRWGRGPAAGYLTAATVCPDEPAIVDDLGTLSFAQLDRRTSALADSLARAGVKEGDGIGIMCRNHRGFVEATVAAAKLGADSLYLNTAFAGPQLTEVVQRERPTALIYDEEFTGLLEGAGEGRLRFVAWHDSDRADDPTLDELIAAGSERTPKPPERVGKTVILTSGTTGSPKGANRASPQSLDPAISLLSKIPLKRRQTTHIAAPLFHSWGFAHFTIGLLLNSTLVLRRRFDPEDALAAVAQSQADSLVVVPVMMQRILALPPEVRAKYDTSSLSIVAASGSALPGDLATEWMDEFGDTLYNLYGSTEVAWATIASPAEMRAAPGTAGTSPRGTVVRLYDELGAPVPEGRTGRIFVANELLFEGYTGGGTKEEIGGLMATGDVGRFDSAGRLFVEGRDDEMIVSGGENVFPKEVEDLLARHDAVAEAAAIGVDDAEFGQRLLAFVVLKPGAAAPEDDLKAYVKANLARYKVPREIRFIDELPRNATGKVLKRELKSTASLG
jgi:acyl-CoA synthetase (AMP-forming)/AMP-acid ligase II